MAIAYLPSEGNIDKVTISTDGIWHGSSIGGAVVDKIKINDKTNNGNYYSLAYANLGSSSRWFYKDVTDYNFINGTTIYRCIYIGADERYSENEVLGNIAASVTHNGPPQANGTISIEILADGIFTAYSSKGSTVLYDEEDSTDVLGSYSGWASSITSNTVLQPGQFLKIWVKISFVQDPTLVSYTNYDYYLTIKDTTIPVTRTSGRLSLAKIFTATISQTTNDMTFEQSVPNDFVVDNIYKVIEHNNLTNIFYFDDNKFKLLIIKRDKSIEDNKYIEIDVTSVLPDITAAAENILANFSICYSNAISGTDPSAIGPSGTPSTTGTINEYPDNNYDYDAILNSNFIADIFCTLKEDRNDFYLFFNKFVSDDSDSYVQMYGHKNYYWQSNVLRLNLNFINSNYFDNVDSGFSNRKMLMIPEQQEVLIKDRFYINSATQQDDLYTTIGYIPEDCRVTNNVSKIIYLWEGEINSGTVNAQEADIPKVNNRSQHVIKNKCATETYLYYDSTLANENKFNFDRSIETLDNGNHYINMGPPTQKAFDHGYSKVSYDLYEKTDQFSATWAFMLNGDSLAVTTPDTTGTTGTSGTSGSPGTSGTSGTSGTPCYYNELIQSNIHLKLQSTFDNSVNASANVGCVVDPVTFVDEFKEIFRIHCNGNEDQSAVNALYNFYTNKWSIVINNEVNEKVYFELTSNPLNPVGVNVITVNTFRKLDYGCAKKYILQYSINVNGSELINGMSYTHDSSDSYVVTHNTLSDFSGYLTYWEVKDYIEPHEAEEYAEAMYRIHANIAWAELESENLNNTSESTSNFAFRRSVKINNLNYNSADSLLFPIVLQGTGYNISDTINKEVRRSVFDFSKIDPNKKSFKFTLEGTSTELDWYADTFNVDKDSLTVWVRLENWNGQRITMFYSDMELIPQVTYSQIFDTFYSVWLMDSAYTITQKRHVSQKVFSNGESYIYTVDNEGIRTLVKINKQTPFGSTQLFKSNKFNIEWNDIEYDATNTDSINSFIASEIKKFKPSFMEINKINSQLPYKLESDNNHKQSDGITSV